MNALITVITLASFAFAVCLGKTSELSSAAISGATEAVTLVISLAGGLCFWSGIMRLASKAGVCDFLVKLISPLLRLVFPKLDKGSKAVKYIGMNVAANLLGLGNAATPFGIEAMRALQALNPHPDRPSNDMVCFAVINSSSIQLVPTTLAVIRSAHGCNNPMDIVPAVIVTSFISLSIGLFVAKIIPFFERKKKK